jgi:hypothetical protein
MEIKIKYIVDTAIDSVSEKLYLFDNITATISKSGIITLIINLKDRSYECYAGNNTTYFVGSYESSEKRTQVITLEEFLPEGISFIRSEAIEKGQAIWYFIPINLLKES